jgi:hydroxyquinol 1,2-dioxygenase
VLGPFYVGEHRPTPHGADFSKGMEGAPMFVQSRVTNLTGMPLAGAEIDVWHADDNGFYDSQKPDYRQQGPSLRARFVADADGRFSFRSILPCSYPIPTDGPVGDDGPPRDAAGARPLPGEGRRPCTADHPRVPRR